MLLASYRLTNRRKGNLMIANPMLAAICVGLGLAAWVSASHAQSDRVYRNTNAAVGRTKALGIYGNLGKDCSVGAVPEVTVRTQPKHGALIVRDVKVKTNQTNRCPNVEVPVQVVLYQGGTNYAGPDEVVYEVRSANGKVQEHTVKIAVVKRGVLPRQPKDAPTDL